MTRFKIGALLTLGLVASLGFSGAGLAEDGSPVFGVSCGGGCADVLARTLPNSLLSAIPGGTFVVTVAHIAPSPEEAVANRRPVKCKPVQFRVDMLRVQSINGLVEVELGDRKSLEAGEASRIVYHVDEQGAYGLPSYDLDLMGFRFRAEPPSSQCNIVASGLFYPDSVTNTPVQFSLIPGAGSNPKGKPSRNPDER